MLHFEFQNHSGTIRTWNSDTLDVKKSEWGLELLECQYLFCRVVTMRVEITWVSIHLLPCCHKQNVVDSCMSGVPNQGCLWQPRHVSASWVKEEEISPGELHRATFCAHKLPHYANAPQWRIWGLWQPHDCCYHIMASYCPSQGVQDHLGSLERKPIYNLIITQYMNITNSLWTGKCPSPSWCAHNETDKKWFDHSWMYERIA